MSDAWVAGEGLHRQTNKQIPIYVWQFMHIQSPLR